MDLGPRRLRDITDPVPVFQVSAPGLRTEFPPLATQDPASGNLRVPTTSLIGREQELGEVATALNAHRVVTLTGPGGVGKTRLALEVAARSADSYSDGVWVIELAPVADPAAVPEAFAAVLGIIQQPGLSLADSVAAALEGRTRLLVVDNCEHVLEAAGDLIELILSRSSAVRVLATSREGLRVADEQQWPVPALEVRTDIDSAAATLFVERARAVASAVFAGAEAAAVVEICRRLDGIPLAIELAASRMASMTATEVRDRLDDRFRLLVGSRRGLEHHHTLRHAVQWSFDFLDDAERVLLSRCSVFAGGFDLPAVHVVAGSGDDLATLDLLDSLVRKSLLVADGSSGRTRFSMLETIRQFAEEQLVGSGVAKGARDAHARYFAGREADVLALWDSPCQREAYDWFTTELANLRTAFRWATDNDDLDWAATIATYAAFLGMWVEQYEPIAWAEELVEPACAINHSRLAFLYVMASQCSLPGRVEAGVRYSEAGQRIIARGRAEIPFGFEGAISGPHVYVGQPERMVEWCRAQLACGRDTHTMTRAYLVLGLVVAGRSEEARVAAEGLVEAAEAIHNPCALSFALLISGYAVYYANPDGAQDLLRRGLVIARETGNRFNESHLALNLSRLEADNGDPLSALDHVALTIRSYHDSGNSATMHHPGAILAVIFDRLERYEPAATIAGFAVDPFTAAAFPEINTAIAHLRDVLGDQTYETLARRGQTMTTAAMATYAFDQIDQARAQLLRAD